MATMTEPRVWEVMLTGGPCAGKTTALARLTETLEELGLRVLVVPEPATRLIMGGLSDLGQLAASDFERFVAVEEQMILMTQDERERYRGFARALGQDTVIVFDRGEMDCCAYIGRERFEEILSDNKLGYREVRDSYSAVIH